MTMADEPEEKQEMPQIQPKDVRKARKAQLQEWCEAFGLDSSGKVDDLRKRLVAFLESEEYLVIEEEKEEEEAPELPEREEGQVYLYSTEGSVLKVLDLPPIFRSEVRTDLIKRAVDAFRANRRQPYGPSPLAGLRHSVSWWGKGRGVSRVPRLKDSRRAAQAPGTVGGRRAHPPRPERDWTKKLNRKERRLARAAALAATSDASLVAQRGHRFHEHLTLPVVVEDKVEELKSTKEAVNLLQRLGVYEDVERASRKKVRAGKGKMRGRRYRRRKGPLVVLSNGCPGRRAFGNLPGVDVIDPPGLNAEVLAPGGMPGRLTIISHKALEEIRSWST
jgi:large subunit ribosomal protein L4e